METDLYDLHRTSTAAKTALSDLTSSAVHGYCMTYIVVQVEFVDFSGRQTGLYDFLRISMAVNTAFSDIPST